VFAVQASLSHAQRVDQSESIIYALKPNQANTGNAVSGGYKKLQIRVTRSKSGISHFSKQDRNPQYHPLLSLPLFMPLSSVHQSPLLPSPQCFTWNLRFHSIPFISASHQYQRIVLIVVYSLGTWFLTGFCQHIAYLSYS